MHESLPRITKSAWSGFAIELSIGDLFEAKDYLQAQRARTKAMPSLLMFIKQ
jgi:hypothetical protein